jgi:putative NIF3 family GTP cyclohydrolase 1 type 2
MAACAEIIGYLDALLDPDSYDGYGPNGLQVPGRDEIQTVIAGLGANAAYFVHARA